MNQPPETTTLRILDAAANRAAEALRVIEDYLRLGLDDVHLTQLAKQLRHDLQAALSAIPLRSRRAARDTAEDVGTGLTTESESRRVDASAVASANFARLQQSLRSLEEFAKIDHPDAATAIEQLRYRTYTLHRAVEITADSARQLADARLYVLIDGRDSLDSFRRLAGALVEAGVDVLQLRDKNLNDRELLARAKSLREATRDSATLFIMNDRPDLARLARADGVHVGQEELSVREVRQVAGPDVLVGVSTHDIAQARAAVLDGANYIGVGPTFPSTTKRFDNFAGLDFVAQVATETTLPAFAIGGIDTDNVQQVIAAGLSRVAVGGAIINANDPAAEASQFISQLSGKALAAGKSQPTRG